MQLPTPEITWTLILLLQLMICSCVYGQVSDIGLNVTGNNWQWRFLGGEDHLPYPPKLGACQTVNLSVSSRAIDNSTGFGNPPYYLRAVIPGGTPRLYDIGSNREALHWTVDWEPGWYLPRLYLEALTLLNSGPSHSQGTVLTLAMIDADGTTGGIAPNLFTVEYMAGQDASCVKRDPGSSDFTITSNLSSSVIVSTCRPLGITLRGGAPPYTFTLFSLNSAFVTNVSTQTDEEDTLTFTHLADSGTQLTVIASDGDGLFARGTVTINPASAIDNSCPGITTSLGNSSQLKLEQDARDAASEAALKHAKQKRATTIASSSVIGGSVFLVGAFLLCRCLHRRRRTQRQGNNVDFAARNFEDLASSSIVLSKTGLTAARKNAPPPPRANRRGKTRDLNQAEQPHSPPPPQSPLSLRQETPEPGPSGQALRHPPEGLQFEFLPNGEVCFRHQDGGAHVVQELPPAYASHRDSHPPSLASRERTPPPPLLPPVVKEEPEELEELVLSWDGQAGHV